jgi:hypothetical protein
MAILPDSDICVKAKLNPRASPPGRLEFIDDAGRIPSKPEVIRAGAQFAAKAALRSFVWACLHLLPRDCQRRLTNMESHSGATTYQVGSPSVPVAHGQTDIRHPNERIVSRIFLNVNHGLGCIPSANIPLFS